MASVTAASMNSAAFLEKLNREFNTDSAPVQRQAYLAVKRLTDILLSLVAIILMLPVMLVIALLIKFTSKGPVIFKQDRAGLGNKPFTMYKFRTMRKGAEDDRKLLAHLNTQSGPVFKIPEDPRLTKVGRFLRRSSLDELPQLFNVLRGDMSLVGPRPLWVPEALAATGAATFRTKVKPGLTCLWQISGRSELSYEEWVLLDLYYIAHRSMLLDLLILVQTVPAVLSTHGAY